MEVEELLLTDVERTLLHKSLSSSNRQLRKGGYALDRSTSHLVHSREDCEAVTLIRDGSASHVGSRQFCWS